MALMDDQTTCEKDKTTIDALVTTCDEEEDEAVVH